MFDPVVDKLEKDGYEIFRETCEADTFVVIGGQSVNPLALNGKRILILHKGGWENKWDFLYRDVLKHYYHKIVDVTGMSIGSVAFNIAKEAKEE